MNIETILIYALRLWLAGALYTGNFLVQIGPFILAGLGFTGWLWAQREPTVRRPRATQAGEAKVPPRFVLR
jgi:hypothetical protein